MCNTRDLKYPLYLNIRFYKPRVSMITDPGSGRLPP